ncbi:MAG TPA: RNA-binding domain-containing protein, partial [Solirubrobacteraceae bacterium]
MSSTVEVGRALDRPASEVGQALQAVHEDQWFDRKSSRIAPRDLGNVLVGFANADGGTIVVGIHADRVEGTDRAVSHRNELMQAHVQFCQPAVPAHFRLIECRRGDGEPDRLLVIEVRSGEAVYANTRDEVFLRIGDENRRLTFAQRQELLYDRGQGTYESRKLEGASLSELDRELLDGYASAVDARDPIRLLRARGLAEKDDLTVAGALLFAKNPQRFLPEAFVRVLRYRGRERGTGVRQQLLYDERVEGPIARQLFAA